MGRELRRVPPAWEHPRDDRGHFMPMFDKAFDEAMESWIDEARRFSAWEAVEYGPRDPDYPRTREGYAQWFGAPPDPELHRPSWSDEERTAYQVYETVSEGTPVSPVLPDREAVIRWWVEVGDSFNGRLTRKQAERWFDAGSSPSMFMVGGVVKPGAQL